MPSYSKPFVLCLIALALMVRPLPALSATDGKGEQLPQGNPPGPEAMTVDLVAVRPLGVVATLAGSAIFIVSLPFSALGGNTEAAWDRLVADPARFTFTRPLGEFDD